MVPVTSPRSTSAGVARWRLERLLKQGVLETHPVIQALAGRIHGLKLTMVPQKNSTQVAAVAWYRASGARPGYLNRHARRKLKRVDVPANNP